MYQLIFIASSCHKLKQNGRRMLTRYASVSETEIPRIQEYAVPQNTKAIKFGIKIYKGWKRLTNPPPTFEQFQDMSLATLCVSQLKSRPRKPQDMAGV